MERFSVYQFFADEALGYERVREGVPLDEAVRAAAHYSASVAVTMRVVKRVIITDSGDCTVWEWKLDEGVVWPKKEAASCQTPGT